MENSSIGKPARTAPVLGKERLDFVDVLRGFALIGVLLANMPDFMGQTGGIRAYPGVLDLSVRVLIQFLVQTKFYHMFSFLFGWGMSMQWRRAEARGAKFVPVFIRRLLILLTFGALHGIFIWTGDILAMYATYGFLLLAFRKRSEKFILISMLVFLAYPLLRSLPIPPAEAFNEWYQHFTTFLHFGDTARDVLQTGTYWEVTRFRFEEFVGRQALLGYAIGNIFAMFLLGLYVGKRRIFENVSQHFGLLRKVMWTGLAVGVVFNAGFTLVQLDPSFMGGKFRTFAYTASYTIGAPFMMLFYVSGLTLLLHPESGYGKFASFVRTRKLFFQRLLWVWVPLAGALTYTYTRFKASAGITHPGLVHAALALVVVFDALVVLLFFTLIFADKFAWRNRLFSLRFVGRMALSNYLTQSVVCTLIFYGYGLGLYGEFGPAAGLAFSVALYMTQLFLSEWWLLRYQFGPVEYIWRTLTYGRRQPLRIGVTYADLQAPRWIQRVRGWTTALPSVLKLGLVWMALLGWGAGLFYWNTQLSQREEAAAFELLEEQPEVAESETVAGNRDAAEVVAIVTPPVVPVAYNPGPVVASGNLGELAATFEAERVLATIEALTKAPYLGRAAGSLEGFRAGSYIASRFETYGLQPAGDDGTFFQSFPVSYASLETEPTISVTTLGGELINSYQLYQDFTPYVKGYAGSGTANGTVVWVNDCMPEDFNTANAAGKIALCNDIDPLAAGRYAMEYGAQGLLLLTDPDERPADTGAAYADTWVPVSIPVLRVYPALVSDLLTGSGKTVPDLSITYLPFDLQTRAAFSVQASTSEEVCPAEGCEARNVLGVLPGRDPALADEVIIVAANYDSYGQAPDGAVWTGANDNASGLAVLLELARTWQEQGYVPSRTVVFAAWDASELGAQGAAYYVANPQYAFDNTIAVFQLKMAGAGADTLFVDQNSAFEKEIELAASALDVPVEIAALPDGDQTPFNRIGVPASLLTWYGDEDIIYQSGRLGDTADLLRVDKLQQYGEILELTLLGFTEAEAQVNAMLAARSAALESGDLDAFLATTEAAYTSFDQVWFADVQTMTPVSFDMTLLDLELGGAEARGTVQVEYALPPEGEEDEPDSHTAIMTARFAHTPAGWQWAGPVLVPLTIMEAEPVAEETIEGEDAPETVPESETTPPVATIEDLPITIYHDPNLADDLSTWPQIINERYAVIAGDLGLPTDTQAQVWLFPGSKSLAASVGLSDQADVEHWVGNGVVKLVYDDELLADSMLDDALVQLVMSNAGVRSDAAPWLWRGLPLVYQARQDAAGIQARYVPSLIDAFAEGTEIDPESDLAAWATAEYARQQLGWNGLAGFVRELGAACQAGSCDDLGNEYVNGWDTYWQAEIVAAQSALDTTLTEIGTAVLAGDQNAYLRLIDTSVPGLRADAESWFAVFAEHPAERFVLSGSPVAFFDDGSMLAAVSQEYALADSESSAGTDGLLTTRIRFTPTGSGYRWAGTYHQQLGGTITVLYPADQSELAETLQTEASSIYARLAEYLQIGDPASLVLKLYSDPSAFRSAVPLTVGGDVNAYSRAGESVRLLVIEEDGNYRAVLADQLARNLLYQMGVDSEWLLSGVSTHLSAQFDGGATQQAAGQFILRVRLAVQSEEIYDLRDLPSMYGMSEEEAGKVKAQAWDSVRYLVDQYGWNTLLAVLRSQAGGASVDRAISSATGVDMDTFVAEWGASLVNGHAAQAWIDTALTFDPVMAQMHIDALTTPEMAGRAAGSEGGRLAADYIAAKFAEYGLQPIGDVIEAPAELETETAPEEGAAVEAESEAEVDAQSETAGLAVGEPGYLQHFPIEYTELILAPRFDIVDTNGLIVDALTYRQDFLSVLYDPKGESKISGELVLVSDSSYTGMDLTGKIVIRNIGEDSLTAEMQKVIEHGGVGLILIGNEENPKVTYAKHPIPYAAEDVETLPILELTQDGYKRLLEAVGFTQAEFYQAPAALPLGSHGLIEISLSVPQQVETANVLGFLPGSDPILGQEVIILGAHYDHSGNDPEMLVCPAGANAETGVGCQRVPGATYFGANDNASGVAILLEIARLWHESGYQPKRSVLFAAWGAQELGQVGSAYYLEHPVVPLEETVFMVQMDAVGGGSGHYLEAQGLWEHEGLLLFNLQTVEGLVDGRLKITVPSEQIDNDPRLAWIAQIVHRSPQSGISDQVVFREYGMPTLLTTWRGASEDNWPDDFADEIDPNQLGASGRMMTVFMMMVAR